MAYKFYDKYSKKAQSEGYKARSAFKLLEMQKKYKLLKPGDRVLDLGCAPGSWSQVASKILGPKGQLIGIDLKEVDLKLPNAEFRQEDVYEISLETFANQKFNCIISDMAPNTSGIKSMDQARSFELCQRVLEITDILLETGGNMTMKVFMGPDQQQIIAGVKSRFKEVKNFRPDSTRKESFEIFVVGKGKK